MKKETRLKKRIISAVTAVSVIAGCMFINAAAVENTVAGNGTGFENGVIDNGWSLSKPEGGNVTNVVSYEGEYSLQLNDGAEWYNLSKGITVEPNTDYFFTAMVKTTSDYSAANATMAVYSARDFTEANRLGTAFSESNKNRETLLAPVTEWRMLGIQFNSGDNTVVYPAVNMGTVNSGTAYIDNLYIEKAGAKCNFTFEDKTSDGLMLSKKQGNNIRSLTLTDRTSDPDNVLTGDYSLKIDGGEVTALYYPLEVEPNTDYKISMSLKSAADYANSFICVSTKAGAIDMENRIQLKDSIMTRSDFLTGISAWKDYTLEFNSGEHTVLYPTLYLFNTSAGSPVYVDNIFSVKSGEYVNGDFEYGTTDGWNVVNNGNEKVCVDSSDPISGKYSLKIPSGAGWTKISQNVTVLPNTDYELRLNYRAAENPGVNMGGVYVSDASEVRLNGISRYSSSGLNTIKYNFNSGNNSIVYVTLFSPTVDTDIYVDDIGVYEINPMANLNFEFGNLLNWSSSSAVITDKVVHGGRYAVQLPKNSNAYKEAMPLVKGNTYRLSFWSKADVIGDGALVFIGSRGQKYSDGVWDSETASYTGRFFTVKPNNTEWKQSTTVFTADNDYLSLRLWNSNGADNWYIDDITLTDISPVVNNAKIIGYLRDGADIKASADIIKGDDGVSAVSAAYQWQISDDGDTWTDVAGATGLTYTVHSDDVSKYVRVKITPYQTINGMQYSGAAVYTNIVTSDPTAYEAEVKAEIADKLNSFNTDCVYLSELKELVKNAEKFGVDLSDVEGIEQYETIKPDLVTVTDIYAECVGDSITITGTFDDVTKAENITKENIKYTRGRTAADYELSAIGSEAGATGFVISANNKFKSDNFSTVTVNIGYLCKYSKLLDTPVDIEESDIIVNDETGRIYSIDDAVGNVSASIELTNNTYESDIPVSVIFALNNSEGSPVSIKISNDIKELKKGVKSVAGAVFESIPENAEGYTISAYVWENATGIKATAKKKTFAKSYGIDNVSDPTKDLNVAFIGGSITQSDNYRVPLLNKLQEDRTGTINSVNAALGGTGSNYGAMRYAEDVLATNPDIVFVEFTLNDLASSQMQQSCGANVESIIRQSHSAEHEPVVVFIHIPDRRTNSNGEYSIAGNIARYNETLSYYGIEALNAHQLVCDVVEAGGSWDTYVSEGNVHPNKVQGENIAELIYNEFKTNSSKYVKNITWNETKKFPNVGEYVNPTAVSSAFGTYDENWSKMTLDTVTEGYGEVTSFPFETFMASNKAGAEMSFEFKGTKMILSTLIGKNGRTASYKLTNENGDTEKEGTIKNKIDNYNWYQNLILEFTDLSDGIHKLTITVDESSNADSLFGVGEFWVDE